jgi:formylglycine-generating enzyme required for sulfatase activity
MKSNNMSNLFGLALVAGLTASIANASIAIDWVTVGNVGNAADPATGSLYGAVGYEYQIGKYEVTNAQYAEFLNAVDPTGANANGIYNFQMGSNLRGGITYTSGATDGAKYTIRTNMGNKPVNFVSWHDSARFTNWLHNGQGSGSTEAGAYTMINEFPAIIKNVGATVWLPSEDEWYKAAYYDPTPGAGGGDNYWLHATQSDTAPTVGSANATGDIFNPGANVANYLSGADWNSQNGNVTTVGSALAANYFGTADQGGNVWEWNDAVFEEDSFSRGLRGGSWLTNNETLMRSSNRVFIDPTTESHTFGFRVASVPEPSSTVLMCSAGLLALARRRRAKV